MNGWLPFNANSFSTEITAHFKQGVVFCPLGFPAILTALQRGVCPMLLSDTQEAAGNKWKSRMERRFVAERVEEGEKREQITDNSRRYLLKLIFLASEFNTGAPAPNSQGTLSRPLASSCTKAAKTASVLFPGKIFCLELNPASICRQEETQTSIDLT